MLHQGGAALHPIPVVEIGDAVDLAHLGLVDMAADHAVDPASARFLGQAAFEGVDELQGVLDPGLQERRKAPVAEPEPAPGPVQPGVQSERRPVRPVSQEGQPASVLDHAVKGVAVGDQEAAAVQRLVDGVLHHHHAAEMHAVEVAHPIVVVAGHVDDLDALARQAQELLHHVVVGLGPVPAALQLPAVDDVAHEIEALAFHVADEVEQQFGLAATRAQVDVRQEHRPVPLNADFALHRPRTPNHPRARP